MKRRALFALFVLWMIPAMLASAGMKFSFVELSEITSMLITCDEKTMLIDAGSEADEDALAAFLSAQTTDIDLLCLTHSDEAHAGNAGRLIKQYGIDAVYAPSREYASSAKVPLSGDTFSLGSAVVIAVEKNGVLTYAVESGKDVAATAQRASMENGKTNTKAVNIRKEASSGSAKVTTVDKGTVFYILGSMAGADAENWYHIRLADGQEGYIRGDLVDKTQESVSANLSISKASVSSGNAASSGKATSSGDKASSEKKTSSGSGQYIGNRNSKIFHRPSCGTLPKASNRVYFDSKDAAKSAGYRGCKKCSP